MKPIAIYKPEHNQEEQKEITTINKQLWKLLASESVPENTDGNRYFVRHSIKIETKDGEITAYDTTTSPYMPIYNRYILKLLLGNIMEE